MSSIRVCRDGCRIGSISHVFATVFFLKTVLLLKLSSVETVPTFTDTTFLTPVYMNRHSAQGSQIFSIVDDPLESTSNMPIPRESAV